MELDHEKFEGIKELAEISGKIAQGTAALASLKEETENYLSEREQKLVQRLKQALVDSSDLITAIGSNHSALVGYSTELTDFHSSVLSLLQGVMELQTLVTNASANLETRLTAHAKDVEDFRNASQRERSLIEGNRSQLAGEKDQLAEGQRLLKDRKEMFERTLKRTKQ